MIWIWNDYLTLWEIGSIKSVETFHHASLYQLTLEAIANQVYLSLLSGEIAQLYDTETLVTRMLLRGMIEYLTSATQLDSLFEGAATSGGAFTDQVGISYYN